MTRAVILNSVGALAAALAAPLSAAGQVIRVATFENFAAGDNWPSTFVDPASGIRFRDSTHPRGGFVINHSATNFGGGLYLAAGGGPEEGFGVRFGFDADLPSPANRVSLDAIYYGNLSTPIVLRGFNAAGTEVATTLGPAGASTSPFHLNMESPNFDIVTFRVSVGTSGAAAYDNVAFTTVPEPGMLGPLLPLLGLVTRRRR